VKLHARFFYGELNFFPAQSSSIVSIVACCGLDDLVIKSQWVQHFLHSSRPAMGPTQPPVQWVPDLLPRDKATRVWCWPPTPISRQGKESVQLYLYSPSGLPWPVPGCTLILPTQFPNWRTTHCRFSITVYFTHYFYQLSICNLWKYHTTVTRGTLITALGYFKCLKNVTDLFCFRAHKTFNDDITTMNNTLLPKYGNYTH